MKKIFSCLLAISTSFVASSSIASSPTVTIGGRMDAFIGYRNLNSAYSSHLDSAKVLNSKLGGPAYTSDGALNNTVIANDTLIHIKVDGKKEDCDLKYGGYISLHADASMATNGETGFGDKAMVYLQHDKVGRLEVGNYPGSAAYFEMDTPMVAKAAYGVDGYWSKWSNENAYIDLSSMPTVGGAIGSVQLADLSGYKYILSPNLPSNYSGEYYSDAPKATFYTMPTPDITIGLSYIPDLDSTGAISTAALKTGGPTDPKRSAKGRRPTFKNIFSGGIQFKKQFNDFSVKASIAGEIGDAKTYKETNLIRGVKAYEAGLNIGYKNFKIAGSYGSWTNTATYKKQTPDSKQNSSYFTLGASHQVGKFGYSVTYMQSAKAGGLEAVASQIQGQLGLPLTEITSASDKKYNKFRNISFGVEYLVAPGFLTYAEVSAFRMKDASAEKSDSGQIYLLGTRITF